MRGVSTYILAVLLAFSFTSSRAQQKSNAEIFVSMENFRLVPTGETMYRVEALDYHYYYSENPANQYLNVLLCDLIGCALENFQLDLFYSSNALLKVARMFPAHELSWYSQLGVNSSGLL